MVPVSALADGSDGLLARFAGELGDLEIRAAATVGGNLCASGGSPRRKATSARR